MKGYYSTGTHSLTVEAGNIASQLPFDISDYSISIGLPATAETNQNYSVTVSVSSPSGVSSENVYVDAYTSHGRISRNQLLTDSSGNLSLNWHTGSEPGTAELIFRTAGDQTQKVSMNIALPDSGENTVVMATPALIGDVAVSGAIDYLDLRNVAQSIDYSAQIALNLNGAPLENKTLQLGTLPNPNRAPLLAFSAANNREENLLSEITQQNTSVMLDHPIGVGKSIQLNSAQSTIEFASTSGLSPEAPIVSFQAKFLPAATAGDLVNINDAFVIAYRNQRVTVNAVTTDGAFELESQIINDTNWHIIDVALIDGILRLNVDNQNNELAVPGSLSYSVSRDVTLDGAANYQLASLKIFDNNSAPLTLFDNGLESIDVVLDATGNANAVINSTGAMHGHLNDSQLPITYVDVQSGEEITTFNVISENHYSGLAETWVDTTDSLPIFSDVAALTIDQHIYQDAQVVAEKILATTAEHDLFSSADRLVSLLAAIEQVPQSEEIATATQKLLAYFRNTDQTPIVLATVDIVGLGIKQALQGDRTALDDLLLPLTVFGELVEANTVVANYMASTVKSKDDLHHWFELFKFPARGWLGLEPPVPELGNTDCNALSQDIFGGRSYSMSSIPCRLTGQRMADWVEDLALSDNFYLAQPQRFSLFVKSLVENLPVSPTLLRRNVFVTEDDLIATNGNTFIQPAYAGPAAILRPVKYIGKLGSRAAKNTYMFFLGKANHRIDPLLMLYIFHYLEVRTNPESGCTGSCRRIDAPDAQKEVNAKIAKVLNNIARAGKLRDQSYTKNGELKCGLVQTSHGDMFELMALAYFHALYEISGDSEAKVVGIERKNEVQVLTKDDNNNIKDERSYTRRADIVLAGDGSADKGIHIELKSMQAAQSQDQDREDSKKRETWLKKKWPLWSLKSKRTTYHRQFVLDHIKTKNRFDESGQPIASVADDFVWYFHTWSDFEERKVKRPGKRTVVYDPGVPLNQNGRRGDTDFDRLEKHVFKANTRKDPRKRLEASLGVNALPLIGGELHHMNPTSNGDKVKLFDWKTLIMENAALSAQMTIPEEVRQQWLEIVNNPELQLVLDIIENYEEIDVLPDIDVDSAWDRAVEKLEGFDLPYSECDP